MPLQTRQAGHFNRERERERERERATEREGGREGGTERERWRERGTERDMEGGGDRDFASYFIHYLHIHNLYLDP